MKTKTFFVFLVVGVILASCTSVVTVAPRADNFAFVIKYAPCGSVPVNVLDSARGTLVHTPLGDINSITISLRLTDDELESIYQKAIFIGFFDYPSNFAIPDDQAIGNQAPASSYELSITNGEMSNSVTWTDDTLTKPSYTKADKLRELMYLINEIIQSHPEIQELPEPNLECA